MQTACTSQSHKRSRIMYKIAPNRFSRDFPSTFYFIFLTSHGVVTDGIK